eukprot:739816-Amorphochlora_amoeboformis.AAC.1
MYVPAYMYILHTYITHKRLINTHRHTHIQFNGKRIAKDTGIGACQLAHHRNPKIWGKVSLNLLTPSMVKRQGSQNQCLGFEFILGLASDLESYGVRVRIHVRVSDTTYSHGLRVRIHARVSHVDTYVRAVYTVRFIVKVRVWIMGFRVSAAFRVGLIIVRVRVTVNDSVAVTVVLGA